MKTRQWIWCLAAALTFAFALSGRAAAADDWMGSWKLDPSKSHYSPGPAPKSMSLTFSPEPGGWKLATEQPDEKGQPVKGGYAGKTDGKEYPWTSNPNADVVMLKRVDDNSFETTWKKGGKVTLTSRGVVSNGGKTLTITQTGKDAQGKDVHNVMVLDRM